MFPDVDRASFISL